MNCIDPFREVYSILSQVSKERAPTFVKTLTEEKFQSIFSRASENEQVLLTEYKTNAVNAAKKITKLPSDSEEITPLLSVAIRNIQLIRHTQQLIALFEGFDESINVQYFKKTLAHIPLKDRIDCVAKALSAKNQLVCPFKRKKLVELLAAISPEERKATKDALVSMLQKCPGRDYENLLNRYLLLVKTEERGSFMRNLSQLLGMVDIGNWPQLANDLELSMESRRASIVQHACQIVSPNVHLNAGTLAAIIRNIKTRLNNQVALTACSQITSICTDATYIPLMIQELCQLTEPERASTITFLLGTLTQSRDSPAIYEAMRSTIRMTAERRSEILRLLSDLQNSPATRMFVIFQALNGPFMMADLEEQFAAMTLDKYRLEVSRDDLKRCPLEVLNTLCNLFQTEKKTELQVTFIGEPSVDVGGPGQELITTLVEEVCKALVPPKDEASLLRPYMRTLKPEHTKALEQLGALLLFCLHSSAKFVIGRQLDPALFVALNKLNKDLITTNFEDIDKTRFKELFAIFEAMYSINEDDQAAILRMKTYMQEDGVSLEPIIDAMRESLEPCFLLYKGMLSTPFSVDVLTEMPYQELEVALQGVLEPKLVVKKLNIRAENTPQEWVREWILGLTPTKMKRFLRLIAGTPALGKRMVNIEFSGQAVQFSTCTQTLTLPESSCTSKHSLFDMLEFSLKTEIKFNAK